MGGFVWGLLGEEVMLIIVGPGEVIGVGAGIGPFGFIKEAKR